MDEIDALVRQLNTAHEDVRLDTLYHLHQYRADALARPMKERVEILQALLKSRLKELLATAKRDGKV